MTDEKPFNPYEVLDIPVDVDEDSLKAAFRRETKKWHPDKPGGERDRYEAAVKAYRLLSDPNLKALYDRTGTVSKASEEQIRSAAYNFIVKTFMEVVQQCTAHKVDISQTNVIDLVVAHCKQNILSVRNEQQAPRKEAASLERMVKRLRRKASKRDEPEASPLHRALQDQIKQYYRRVEALEEQIDWLDECLVVLRDYTMDPEAFAAITSATQGYM